jgi:cation:H+ antiporter
VLCAGVIAVAGTALTRYGDIIARLSGLSRSWVGLALVATATSLPELFTGISSVTIAGAPNIAVGDVLGSCLFNLALLVLLDVMNHAEPMFRRIDQGHVLTAGFGVILIGFVGALLLLGHQQLRLQFFGVGAYAPLLLALYVIAMRSAFLFERRVKPVTEAAAGEAKMTLGQALARYAVAALVVAVAGSWLPFIGLAIAHTMGWQTSFVGTLLIAGATSLPEMVVAITAVRIGATDMAIANLLGSNLFDVLILAVDDVAYRKGPLLWSVSPTHAISAFAAVIMSGIFIVASLYQPEGRIRGAISWVSLSLLVIYLASSYATFVMASDSLR